LQPSASSHDAEPEASIAGLVGCGVELPVRKVHGVNESALAVYRCIGCGGEFVLDGSKREGDEIVSGSLRCRGCDTSQPIVDGIPRFVPPENYAGSFGFQWLRFGHLQVDRVSGRRLSHERFFLETGLRPENLVGRRVLEVGCGGGRFSEVVLETGAELFAVDMSAAVEKNREIHRGHPRLQLAQASLFELPFAPASFDLVFCFGVLQHTPSPERSFHALAPFVASGGRLAVDVYAAHPKQTLHWKYLFRPVTRRLPEATLLRGIEVWVPALLPLHKRLRAIPKVGRPLSRLIPVMAHEGILGQVAPEQEVDWVVLETLDALSPRYDRPRSRRALERWFREAGFVDLNVRNHNRALNYGWGTRPARSKGESGPAKAGP
jgi:SAM-dependent methyltransferase